MFGRHGTSQCQQGKGKKGWSVCLWNKGRIKRIREGETQRGQERMGGRTLSTAPTT